MYEKYICPRIKTVEFYVRTGTKHTELSTTFTLTEFAKTHLQQSRLQKKIFENGFCPHLSFAPPQTKFLDPPLLLSRNKLVWSQWDVSGDTIALSPDD